MLESGDALKDALKGNSLTQGDLEHFKRKDEQRQAEQVRDAEHYRVKWALEAKKQDLKGNPIKEKIARDPQRALGNPPLSSTIK